jgi:hypothetical protein
MVLGLHFFGFPTLDCGGHLTLKASIYHSYILSLTFAIMNVKKLFYFPKLQFLEINTACLEEHIETCFYHSYCKFQNQRHKYCTIQKYTQPTLYTLYLVLFP